MSLSTLFGYTGNVPDRRSSNFFSESQPAFLLFSNAISDRQQRARERRGRVADAPPKRKRKRQREVLVIVRSPFQITQLRSAYVLSKAAPTEPPPLPPLSLLGDFLGARQIKTALRPGSSSRYKKEEPGTAAVRLRGSSNEAFRKWVVACRSPFHLLAAVHFQSPVSPLLKLSSGSSGLVPP